MKKVAVILANGFEEIEALTPVDVLRRASMECDMVGLTSLEVEGSHGIKVQADKVFDGDLSAYDMVVLPGGMPGSVNLRDHTSLIAALQAVEEQDKYVAAICAAPIVLEKAGLLAERRYTCYPGQEAAIPSGQHTVETVVVDGNIVTSRGAGTALDFAYRLVDLLGGDGASLANAMVYQ
ncbi:DJ-1 family glyoxalase III [Streptococcus cuniculi]|uniref:DJ-1/PfpI family protein n=1 Tax=Streptococcus cuniculi TaxID=1432788 RepID=A0A4Y9JG86_9STRE|nr:DJ-1 family glyoxalase III [Streptococcus cuniculi]MBF0777431.1 DJ-1/PfpI family protein [Streptococcus cuniculi]TFU99026.1 DJ-1/PfpI family protein [Streptococcus cuniculi]